MTETEGIEWQHSEISKEEARQLLAEREKTMQDLTRTSREIQVISLKAENHFEDRHYNRPDSNDGIMETRCKCLTNIRWAWERFEHNTWGICTECGEEIPRGRLEAIPETEYCTPCAKEYSTQGHKKRRVLRPDLSPSFA